jgi:hypothetical protein
MIQKYILVSLGVLGYLLAQTAPQAPEPRKPLLDLTFPPPGFQFQAKQKSLWLQPERLQPKGAFIARRGNAPTCSIPLKEIVPKDYLDSRIKKVVPAPNKVAPMPQIKPPAPPCRARQ